MGGPLTEWVQSAFAASISPRFQFFNHSPRKNHYSITIATKRFLTRFYYANDSLDTSL